MLFSRVATLFALPAVTSTWQAEMLGPGRTALVMSDNRRPWPPSSVTANRFEPLLKWERGATYYSYAVALAASYARRHCYDLRLYRFRSTGSKHAVACSHSTAGPRAIQWCKIIAMQHTLWQRTPNSSHTWMYEIAVYLDSDVYFAKPLFSITDVLMTYTPNELGRVGDGVAHRKGSAFAWFASNKPWALADGLQYSAKDAGRGHLNSAFFILRNGRRSQDLMADWWDGAGARAFHFTQYYEQVALELLLLSKAHPGVVMLNSSRLGYWKHMGQHANAPTAHIDSSVKSMRLPVLRSALLLLMLEEAQARSSLPSHAHGMSCDSSQVLYVELPRNLSTDLRRGPAMPGPVGDDEWLARSQKAIADGKQSVADVLV